MKCARNRRLGKPAMRLHANLALEGIRDAVNARWCAFFEDDLDDIKAPRKATGVEQFQPRIGPAFDEFLFPAIHGIERSTDTSRAARFDFDEKQQFAASGDDIHLPSLRRAVIPIEHLFALRAEPMASDAFAEIADFLWRPRTAIRVSQMATRVEQPAETSDGECDKVREHGAHGDDLSYHIRCVGQSHIAEILEHIVACCDRVRPWR